MKFALIKRENKDKTLKQKISIKESTNTKVYIFIGVKYNTMYYVYIYRRSQKVNIEREICA